MFYALDLATGTVDWSQNLGFQPKLTCSAIGIVSTATVAPDPVSGTETV
jgi:outer membrane protein assembly factor BamB